MTRSALDQDHINIRDNILRMAGLVDQAIELAFKALKSNDDSLAQDIVNNDDKIDNLHHEVEEHILETYALQQPMARDLRKLTADLLISNELERMGDHAEGIAQTQIRYSADVAMMLTPQLDQMQEVIHKMMQHVMDAYAAFDGTKAREAAKMDEQLDVLYQEMFDDVVGSIRKGTGKHPKADAGRFSAEEGTYVLWIGHALERIGDRVTNIAERVYYADTGKVPDFNPKSGDK